MKQLFLYLTIILFLVCSCEKTTQEEPKVIETPVNCQQTVNTENMVFILPNSSKIQLDYFGEMNIEQYSTGTRIVKLSFNPKKLANALKNVSDTYKLAYPKYDFGFRISLSNDKNELTPTAFAEKYESGVGAVGIDQLLQINKENLSWDDLVKLSGGSYPVSREFLSIIKDEKIYFIFYGAHKNRDTNVIEYWTQNKVNINPFCK